MVYRPDSYTFNESPLRLLRGTKLSDIPSNPPPKVQDIDSSYQLAEYLALLVRHDPHNIKQLVEEPERSGTSKKSRGSVRGEDRSESDRNAWIYEHLRRIPTDLTTLVTSLLGVCTAQSCPKMKADEWQYLCVAHGSEDAEECSAIDYILHTLDSTMVLLTSPDAFPSRIEFRPAAFEQFPSLFRRLSRIFSHAYFHHREQFQLAEAETSLYARFVALCEKFDLVGTNLLIIPRHVVAESIDGPREDTEAEAEDEEAEAEEDAEEEDEDFEDEEEDTEERDSRRREKGGEGRRPHSLDRHARPHKLDDLRKEEGTIKGKIWTETQESSTPAEEESTPSSSNAPISTPVYQNSDPVSLNTTQTYSLKPRIPKGERRRLDGRLFRDVDPVFTLGRSTLGKKSRGTMLWTSTSDDTSTSDSPVTSTEETTSSPVTMEQETETDIGEPLERTESVETAILVPEDLEGEGPVVPSSTADVGNEQEGEETEEAPVPKDEIELLEEEGKLQTADAVSPLPSTTAEPTESSANMTTPISTQTEKEDDKEEVTEPEQEEVKIDDQPTVDSSHAPATAEIEEEKKEQDTTSHSEESDSKATTASDEDIKEEVSTQPTPTPSVIKSKSGKKGKGGK